MSLPQPDPRTTASTPPRAPRWVKFSVVIALGLMLLVIISMFISGGKHSPSRHLRSGTSGYTAPSAQPAQYLTQVAT